MVQKLQAEGPTITPVGLVDGCLRLLGCYELEAETRRMLITHAEKSGDLPTNNKEFAGQVAQMLQMIVATKEYLYA